MRSIAAYSYVETKAPATGMRYIGSVLCPAAGSTCLNTAQLLFPCRLLNNQVGLLNLRIVEVLPE